jgi:gamma-glutamylcyclotransferase (GGCT)/AIG2-like uncharacterized protein YtfP
MQEMSDYLFLYGTLLPDQAPGKVANFVRQLRRVGPATARGKLYDFGEYPGAVVDSSSNSLIHGEVFELPSNETGLAMLDHYEEFEPWSPETSLFVRSKTEVRLESGRLLNAWIYLYNRDPADAPEVIDGSYSRSRIA